MISSIRSSKQLFMLQHLENIYSSWWYTVKSQTKHVRLRCCFEFQRGFLSHLPVRCAANASVRGRGWPLETDKTWLSAGSLREQASQFPYLTTGPWRVSECLWEASASWMWSSCGWQLIVTWVLVLLLLAISVVAPPSPTPRPKLPRCIVLFHCLHSTHRCLICSHSLFVLLAAACIRSERAGISPVFLTFASPVFKIAGYTIPAQ